MKTWLLTNLAIALAIVPCGFLFWWLGYEIHWPTLFYTLVVMIVADVVRACFR